ncbi:MAG: helix-turn-helix transcriptional regulator [Clostridia bacterium]|nr:helix-turn-helix transcriptional regulator [Clostridia bacterium]
MEIGALLRNARNQAGMTQEQAAEALLVSRQTVSNWETGKSFPDIVSVIRMSELYDVSLDRLLKEESSVKQTYKQFLEESTNTVKSRRTQSVTTLVLVTLGVWALSVLAVGLVASGVDNTGYSVAVMWAVLPVTFFVVSFLIGRNRYFGRGMYISPLVFSLLYSLCGYATSIAADGQLTRTIRWPDFTKLPLGLLITAVGLGVGILTRVRQMKTEK